MKKLLSILAVVGLTATSASAVVSCSSSDKGVDNKTNAPTVKYSDFEKWVAETKGTDVTDVVFVGGKKDVDSLSWLAARKQYTAGTVNTTATGVSDLTNEDNIKSADADFSKAIADQTSDQSKTIYSIMNNIDSWNGQGGSLAHDEHYSSMMTNYFWKDSKKPTKMNLRTILVDDVSTFWKNGIGSTGIIDKFMNQQITDMNTWKHDSDNMKPIGKDSDTIKKNEISTLKDKAQAALEKSKGPFFLLLNNGKLAGITSGYKNYSVFNKDAKTSDLPKDGSNDIVNLFKYFQTSVYNNLPTWLNNNWLPTNDPSSTSGPNAFIKDDASIDGWTSLADTNKTWSKDDSSSSSSAPSGQSAYKLDVTKYID